MKRDNINYTWVGSLVLVSMALLLYAMARLSGNTEKHDLYFATFPNVAGIADGTVVTFDGYQVGRVQSIEPVLKDARLQYRIGLLFKQNWKIPADSLAAISSSGLLSGQQIDIAQGKAAQHLSPGQEITAQSSASLMAGLDGLVSDLRGMAQNDIRPMLQDVRPVLTEVRPVLQDVRLVLQNLNKQTESLGGMLKQQGTLTLDQANSALSKLNLAAENLGQLLNTDNRQHFNNMMKNGDQSTEKINQAVAEFQQTGTELRYAMQQTQAMLANLERASRNMNELTRKLNESPSVIFSSAPAAELTEAKK